MSIFSSAVQVLAFFFPSPVNAWLLRLTGAKIDAPVSIDPGVLILARNIEIGKGARIKFGTMISVRSFRLGKKSKIGFFTNAKGESDLLIGDACIIGPKCMINCSREVVLERYSGVGPGSYLYTHGSGMPVTEGYRATFAPIRLKEKVWVSMRCAIGPGVTIGEGTNVMPGTVLVESVPAKRLVAGNPAKLTVFPQLHSPMTPDAIREFAHRVLEEYCGWSNEYEGTRLKVEGGRLSIGNGSRRITVSVDGDGDIALLTARGDTRDGMYFNLQDLRTDDRQHPVKRDLEAYMRMYYGLIFL
jgi:acetyltransferase-like isoleucine patch superfamily enzyme